MARLMFRCPYTNQPIQPGIELAEENFKAVADYPISMHCPHCGRRHHGSMGDGCLIEQRAPPLAPTQS